MLHAMEVSAVLAPGTITGVTVLALREFLHAMYGEDRVIDMLQQQQQLLPQAMAELFVDPGIEMDDLISEELLINVVAAITAATGTTTDEVVSEFGQYFLSWAVDRTGFDQALYRVSDTFLGFVRCLNQLLVSLYIALGNRRPGLPEAQVTDVTSNSFRLGVFVPSAEATIRNTILLAMYKGIMERVATNIFQVQIHFESPEVTIQANGRCYLSCKVTVPEQVLLGGACLRSTMDVHGFKLDVSNCKMGLDPDCFNKLQPFHFAVDLNFKVIQAGDALKRILPGIAHPGVSIDEIIEIRLPRVTWSLEDLRGVLENDLSVKVALTSRSGGVDLCGGLHRVRQMHRDGTGHLQDGEDALVFLGSPQLSGIRDMERLGLYLSDFPPHETTPDQILMGASHQVKANEALRLAERSNIALKESLAEALAQQQDDAGRPKLSIDSAGHTMLKLLDRLLIGADVDAQQVVNARNALLRSGNNVWKPLDVDWSQAEVGDREVNEALAKLLGAPGASGSSSDGDTAPSDSQQPQGAGTSTSHSASQPETTPSSNLHRNRAVSLAAHRKGSVSASHSPGASASPSTVAFASLDREDTPPSQLLHSVTAHRAGAAGAGPGAGAGAGAPGGTKCVSLDLAAALASTVGPEQGARPSDGRPLHGVPAVGAKHAAEAGEGKAGVEGKGGAQGAVVVSAAAARVPESLTCMSWFQRLFGGPKASNYQLPPTAPTAAALTAPLATGATAAQLPYASSASTLCAGDSTPVGLPPPHVPAGASPPPASANVHPMHPGRGRARPPSPSPSLSLLYASAPAIRTSPGPPVRGGLAPGPQSPPAAAAAGGGGAGGGGGAPGAPVCPTTPVRKSGEGISMGQWRSGEATAPHPFPPEQRPPTVPMVMRLLHAPTDEISGILSKVDEWQFDSFSLETATNGRPLSCLGYHLMVKMDLVKKLGLDNIKLARFLMRCEDGYGDHPYHSRTHASDVLRSLHVVLTRGGVLSTIAKRAAAATPVKTLAGGEQEHLEDTSVQLFSCYLSAIVHDYEHRGVNNDFLIRSSDPLAILYNDLSPLENHHVAAAFTLMNQEPYAFLAKARKGVRTRIRKDVVELVLATDMKQHFALTSSFSLRITQNWRFSDKGSTETKSARRSPPDVSGRDSGSGTMASSGLMTEVWDRETEILLLKMALKAADLGHLTSHTEVHKLWVARLEEELFRQGDRERADGQSISPLMDRMKSGIQKSQCGFFTVVAMPMYQAFTQAFPSSRDLLSNLETNFQYWKEVEAGTPKSENKEASSGGGGRSRSRGANR